MFKIIVLFFIFIQSVQAFELIYTQGSVRVNGEVGVKGKKLIEGDLIETGENSLAIVSFDSLAKTKILPNSFLKVIADNETKTTVELSMGALMAQVRKVDKNNADKFVVKAKSVAMGVRGTEFFVAYGKSNSEDLWMCVEEGLVAVKDEKLKSEVFVKTGQGVKITTSEISLPTALPWTKKLNWNMDETKKLDQSISIEEAYSDPLGQDYD